MKQLISRISKIEKEIDRVDAIRIFLGWVKLAVTQADLDGGRKLAELVDTREREFVKNPGKMLSTLLEFINHLDSDARDRTIEILVRLWDGSKGETDEQTGQQVETTGR